MSTSRPARWTDSFPSGSTVKLRLPTVSQMPGSLVPGWRGKTQRPVPEKSKLPSVPDRASQ